MLDHTHDSAATSWLASANRHPDFPIQNLPLARFTAAALSGERIGTAIGDQVLDLTGLAARTDLPGDCALALAPLAGGSLAPLMAEGPAASRRLRHALFKLLESAQGERLKAKVTPHLLPAAQAQLLLPIRPPTFSDYYCSIYHARNVGSLVRPDNPITPNFHYMPLSYHGRSTSVLPSGQNFHRPRGQGVAADKSIRMGPAMRLDYEAELGFLAGLPSPVGATVTIENAVDHLFGVALLNDWSARDIQFWEYVPLGPLLGKSFATTLGGWVVTREALEPFWCAPPWDGERSLLPHLDSPRERESGALDIYVETFISTERMRAQGLPRHRLALSNAKTSYWTPAQMIAHQTSNGAPLDSGDLMGSGTLSGPEPSSYGCLLEITRGGQNALTLPSGETRTYLEDGDEITLAGYCEVSGRARIGLGEASARVLPSRAG